MQKETRSVIHAYTLPVHIPDPGTLNSNRQSVPSSVLSKRDNVAENTRNGRQIRAHQCRIRHVKRSGAWNDSSEILVTAAFDLVDVHATGSSVLHDEFGNRASLTVVAVAWCELVDLDRGRLEDFLRVKAGGDDDAD